AVPHVALAAHVDDAAVLAPAPLRRHLPLLGGSGNEHFARGGAGLAHVILGTPHRAAAVGVHVAIDAVALEVDGGLDDLNLHFAPIAFELFGEHHGNGGVNAPSPLPAPGAPEDAVVVGMNDDPRVDLGSVLRSMRYIGNGKLKSKYEGASSSSSAGQE